MKTDIILRPAVMNDGAILLTWRNDPETKKASHNTTDIQSNAHILWLSQILKNPHRKLYIAEEEGVPVGTIRADFAEGTWELSWTVSPKERGRGIAKQMVSLLAKQISQPIRAEIKTGNIASAQVAEYAGMKFEQEIDGVLHYKRA